MTPQHVISQLLESDTKYPKNLDLLKKIIITAYLGRFRVNGQSPDNKISLANYLFDEERVMFDYTRLSDEKKELFLKWLLEPHQAEKETDYFNGVHVNEYRGFTAEVALSWWGRLLSWFENRFSELWKITDLSLSLNYQLTSIEVCHGNHGSLIGFNQFLAPRSGTKYKAPDDLEKEPLGNAKRVFITDKLVEQLTRVNLKNLNFESVCRSPHPQSIVIADYNARYTEMYNYRQMQKYADYKPWYLSLWQWFVSFFYPEEKVEKRASVDNSLKLLYENETVKIYEREITKEVIVQEKRPDINNAVFCGGGGKIFAHVGVWRALCEANIRLEHFAGSSAGAIMSLFCYLGYSADEITDLFKHFKQEHLVFFDIDRNGLSDPHALKTSLDYAIALKVKQIVAKYNIPFPQGKITFATLDNLKKQCPDCGIGEELIVTATKKKSRQTRYFSLTRSPNFEVSEAVKISASIPPIYRGTFIDGEEHNDGGVLSNFPTEAFGDDHTTLLESEYGNNLKVLAVQFDNGTERFTIDRLEQVYRENFILNWIYSLITGVSDPASGWEQDRMKLRKYAAQSLVVNVDDVSTTSFTIEDDVRNKVIQKGYETTKSYLDVRYKKNENGTYENKEYMYSTFHSLGDLLSYCCYRGDKHWFEIVNNLIVQSSLPNRASLMKQSLELRELYFKPAAGAADSAKPVVAAESNSVTFFGNDIPQEQFEINEENHNVLLSVYPIFLKISSEFVKSSIDKRTLEVARHSLTLQSPFRCLEHLEKIKDESNIVLHIFIKFIRELKENPSAELYRALQDFRHLMYSGANLFKAEYYDKWDLSIPQCLRVLKLFSTNQHALIPKLLASLCEREEPLQTVVNGVYYDDFSEDSVEEERLSFSL
ncbi:Dot/Icm T4SS effector VpdC [Legionella fallonii]|uniref:Protein with patatin domain n=1 Tax=Legionella fallonii LLAP-10 TaxID=1212491 RepID=A0A098G484_9GAMM|nr:Dot/Icm T4SS effector VpdC [Legionella fallonii]CEG56794.1 protein with patatin domain [Legionella fallonii LLAP-10]